MSPQPIAEAKEILDLTDMEELLLVSPAQGEQPPLASGARPLSLPGQPGSPLPGPPRPDAPFFMKGPGSAAESALGNRR